jgi:hypothetical protein
MSNEQAIALSASVDQFAEEMGAYLQNVPSTDELGPEVRQLHEARLSAMHSELASFRERMRGLQTQ